jgi:hypothetical protein
MTDLLVLEEARCLGRGDAEPSAMILRLLDAPLSRCRSRGAQSMRRVLTKPGSTMPEDFGSLVAFSGTSMPLMFSLKHGLLSGVVIAMQPSHVMRRVPRMKLQRGLNDYRKEAAAYSQDHEGSGAWP